VPTLHTREFDCSGESVPVHDQPDPCVHVTVESAPQVLVVPPLELPLLPLLPPLPLDVLLTVHPVTATPSTHIADSTRPRTDMTKPP